MNTLKAKMTLVVLAILTFSMSTHGQGTFIYDQQSAIESGLVEGGMGIQANQPIGQSFTPTNSSVGFFRLYLYDGGAFSHSGATVYLNLVSNSISGKILGSTDPVSMPDGFGGFTNFFFSVPIAVTPGVIYYFQLVVQNGDPWGVNKSNYNYPGGTAIYLGVPDTGSDLWFREGVMVPEPSALSLLISSGVLFYVRRAKNGK